MKSTGWSPSAQHSPKLVEDLDFYWESGKMVLTAYFLKNRGYCCKNGCRHCPFEFSKAANKQTTKFEDGPSR
ncbi:MAG: hypothetical protein IPN76_10845 [Saprospiraceae bacterium]|nr:hypothetical protein [Saprospiraceae bacterium]